MNVREVLAHNVDILSPIVTRLSCLLDVQNRADTARVRLHLPIKFGRIESCPMHVFKAEFYAVLVCDCAEFGHTLAHELRVDIYALFQSRLRVKSVRFCAERSSCRQHRAEYFFRVVVSSRRFVEQLRLELRVECVHRINVKIAFAFFKKFRKGVSILVKRG